jgi:predicted amidohydrolase YtcJ
VTNRADRPVALAVTGGPISAADGGDVGALAVHNGRIVALGAERVRALVGPGTEVLDLAGRRLLPGFHDAHVHPLFGGIERLRCDLTGSSHPGECLRRVGEHARSVTHPQWILGGGWEMGLFPGGAPERGPLDAVTGWRPAHLLSRDHHSAWVNSAALELAGIDRGTPDPPDGRIERDPDGRPTGTLHEGAVELVAAVLPTAGEDEYRRGLLEGQRFLHAHGVTSWHDAILGSYAGYRDALDTYLDLDRRGLLTATVRGALWWRRDRGLDQIEDLVQRRARARGERFRADAVKIMVDGICENLTAAMRDPYLGDHGSGLSFVDGDDLAEAVRALDARGFPVHFHAVGDQAVHTALDAVAHARGVNGNSGLRHQIAHLQVVDPADVPRFAELGVTATIQAAWAVNDADMTELTAPLLGAERARRQYPFRSLRDAGAALAAGSDWPVSEADPLLAAHVAVNRSDAGQEPLVPEESLELRDVLAACTAGSARVNALEDRIGALRVGMDADLVVLDRDPFSLPHGEISDTRVDMTFVRGQLVHQR